MKQPFAVALAAVLAVAGSRPSAAQTTTRPVMSQTNVPAIEVLPPVPQDQGLPYTRSAQAAAMRVMGGHLAVYPGSRYAYVAGKRVRLDNVDILNGEAAIADGKLYVPTSFTSVVAAFARPESIHFDAAPAYLAARWVYTPVAPTFKLPGDIPQREIDGKPYIDLVELARRVGLTVSSHPRGLALLGASPVDLATLTETQLDTVISQFDTPEKFADPDIATRHIPTLKRQGRWTDHVKVTPEQLALLNGPETKWQFTPASQFDFTGFNASLLGSKVPPPGVYPRVLFSPEDVPSIAARIRSTTVGQMSLAEIEYLLGKSWLDPKTSDGQIFDTLAGDQFRSLRWDDKIPPNAPFGAVPHLFKGQKPGITNSHVAYVPECLNVIAFYSLITDNEPLGRKVATAIANYYTLREPLVDDMNAMSDTELSTQYTAPDGRVSNNNGGASTSNWREMHGIVAYMNLGLSLDFAGKWMTPEQRDTMRRVIVKATYGRRAHGSDGPVRHRDINHISWDLPSYVALCAIEGLDGCDPEPFEANRQTIKAFVEWGIDPDGVIYESNGKTSGGNQHHLLAMIALARRGENLFGHPHYRKLADAQALSTSPNGEVVVNSGTQYTPFSREHFSTQYLLEYASFFPGDKGAQYLLTNASKRTSGDAGFLEGGIAPFDLDKFRAGFADRKRMRLPSVTYPGFVRAVLFDSDFVPTTRAQAGLPLDFVAPTHGVFSAYSSNEPDATWMHMLVRPDHYIGAGHHHSDAGMFHFSALGVNWFTESPMSQAYDGKFHNQVLVDGWSEPDTKPDWVFGLAYQAAAKWLGAETSAVLSQASTDLTDSYTYRWFTQIAQVWEPGRAAMKPEFDPSPRIAELFAGTARYKRRHWWPTSNYVNYMPTCRALSNPMRYVFRTTALARGPVSFGVVADDLRKDDAEHLYEWTAMLNGGVWQAKAEGVARNQMVLAYDTAAAAGTFPVTKRADKPALEPKPGDPLLLVTAIGADEIGVATLEGPPTKPGQPPIFYDRLTAAKRDVSVAFRVILVPYRAGEPLPQVKATADGVTVTTAAGTRRVRFEVKDGAATKVRLAE
jgi:hypothetical protein